MLQTIDYERVYYLARYIQQRTKGTASYLDAVVLNGKSDAHAYHIVGARATPSTPQS